MNKTSTSYDFSKTGLEHWFGPARIACDGRAVVVWPAPAATPKGLARVGQGMGRDDWQTTLLRLLAKGLVGRNSDHPIYRYFATMPRAAWEQRQVFALLNSLAEEYGDLVDAWMERGVVT